MSTTNSSTNPRARLRALVRDNLRFLATGRNPKSAIEDDAPTVTLQVGQRVFENAPRSMRQELWRSALQRHGGAGARAAAAYKDACLKSCPPEAAAEIEKDLGRTFPNHRRFAASSSAQGGQRALGRVLRAYASFDPEISYCQGMSFVAALLLMVLDGREDEAFGALVLLLHGADHALRPYYDSSLSALQLHLWQLGRLMPPRLSAHLESVGALPSLYAASWLMTIFSADFPTSFSQRVMDVVLSDSSRVDAALLKAAVALLRSRERALMACADVEEVLVELKQTLPAMGEEFLHDVLTDAFCSPWEGWQLRLLASTEGSETVAQAVRRVEAEAAARGREEGEDEGEGEREGNKGGAAACGDQRSADAAAADAAAATAERMMQALRVSPLPPPPRSTPTPTGSGAGAAPAPAADLLLQIGEPPPPPQPARPSGPVHQSSAHSFGSWTEAGAGGSGVVEGAGGGAGGRADDDDDGAGSDGSFSGLARQPRASSAGAAAEAAAGPAAAAAPPPPRPPPPPDDSLI